jgi:hypothetical protein
MSATGREPFAEGFQVLTGVFHFGEDFVGVLQELPAGGGEIDVATEPVEEATLEVLFERFDGVTDSGLREMELASGVGETSNTSQGREGEELAAV